MGLRAVPCWSDDDIAYFLSLPEVRASHYYPMLCLSALLGPRRGLRTYGKLLNYDLLHHRLIWKKKILLQDKSWGNNDYLFVSQNGLPIKPHQYATGFKRLLSAHIKAMEDYEATYGTLPANARKLPYITLYGFRTSFATNNMRRCPNAALISSVMGNSPKTLIQFYTQSDMEMQKDLIDGYVNLQRTIS